MKKNKRKIITIIASLLIIVLIAISLIYLNTQENNVEIKSSLKEYNAELEENENMHLEEDASGDKVPVPNGYVGSKVTGENEIDTGYVIYEGTDEVNDSNVEEEQKTRNQYVWIPVPDASTMYGTDENGKKWGKLYEFTTETGEDIDEATGTKPLNWSESGGVITILDKNSYREPDIIKNRREIAYDTNSRLKSLEIGLESSHEFLNQLEKEFNSIIESMKKYEGFYIGRYETGDLSKDKVSVTKGNNDIHSETWYTMYKKCNELRNENVNVGTGLIWGSQWDRTLIWLIETGNKTKEEICSSNSESNIKQSTGLNELTKANNIYDLIGNYMEYTMESYSEGKRAYRGFNNVADDTTYIYAIAINDSVGCRAMLYIK